MFVLEQYTNIINTDVIKTKRYIMLNVIINNIYSSYWWNAEHNE